MCAAGLRSWLGHPPREPNRDVPEVQPSSAAFVIYLLRAGQNLKIGVLFTVVSLIRGYGVRRLFNHFHRSK